MKLKSYQGDSIKIQLLDILLFFFLYNKIKKISNCKLNQISKLETVSDKIPKIEKNRFFMKTN